MVSELLRTLRIVIISYILLLSGLPVMAENQPKNRLEAEPEITVRLPVRSSKGSDWLYHSMAANYVVLNTLDLVTTYKSISKGAEEVNPIARTFIASKPVAVAFKASLTGGMLFALGKIKNHDRKAAYVTLGLLNILYGVVVTNNIGVYLHLQK